MSRSAGAERCRPAAWWPAAVLLVLATPAAAEGPGQQAYAAGRYEDAVRAWRTEAQAGDKDASFALGVAYDLGQGVARDAALACRFYGEAGDRGHVPGAFNAGILYDTGQCGGDRQADLAALWYGRAAAAGSARAQFNLAQLYAAGDGVPRNPAVAATWFRAAAANGIPAATGRNSDPARAGDGQGPLLPVFPAFPDPVRPMPHGAVTLVWTAPNQPVPVRFFVEVYALQPSGPVELAGRYVDVTAVRLPLPPSDATRFTWRVLTVGADPPRYATGPWRDFEAAPAAPRTQ